MNENGSPRITNPSNEVRKYMRLPRAGQRDPLFGFSRSVLNSLILPCKENDYSPSAQLCPLQTPDLTGWRSLGRPGLA
jgi:hypothetical protein